ncbi:RluA family pseudouridine synthase [Lentilactobacillus hilgardii]|jgi:23S rRNA pseudouridine1911/1915/1917 synthase|uniref:Pseudouridine synthase n=1 Tax=Lentilactobacillus hilgardii TaxID=1588 RepID=A0A6P1ED51_LENHI|nr:RluA family pseudouridine synthase [Lentilactobacillus hilgardii]EEI70684.1 pseudouridine synthase, RluA family [Lentilactobacillus hilgardii ATCC 27305]MCT3390426.1 RluA family pseudouridine synthase [Lentilactobacillus hilgardii]QHB52683.1 RluA family pseudouridine synthase [Lentilactobacillus hilgardii]RRG09336.1 MAG: RluA family pseudouridine synthase [Lactobacillus sp.]
MIKRKRIRLKFTWQKQSNEPKTLKKFLNTHGISHRMYKNIKTSGQVLINSRSSDSQTKLADGDQVTVILPDEAGDPNVAVSEQPIKVVYEDDNWLVVDKPAGLTVVPGPANRDDTLVNRVKGYLVRAGVTDLVPHIITRLDRFTSGLVLIAKHRLANSLANELLAAKQLHKRYLAVVSGGGLPDHGRIQKPIAKDPNGYGQIISDDGRFSDTEYWVRQRLNDDMLVEVALHTGRTHQIRVHFASIGHPLLGDQLYHGPMNMGIDRQALHAVMLGFNDPFSQSEIKLKSPLPKDMSSILD